MRRDCASVCRPDFDAGSDCATERSDMAQPFLIGICKHCGRHFDGGVLVVTPDRDDPIGRPVSVFYCHDCAPTDTGTAATAVSFADRDGDGDPR